MNEQLQQQMQEPGYTWFLFGDLSVGHTGARFWQSGPGQQSARANMHQMIQEGARFVMVDAHGEAKFEGYIVGDYAGTEPLDDYGAEHGCVAIHWES